jgi:hypothetical protein
LPPPSEKDCAQHVRLLQNVQDEKHPPKRVQWNRAPWEQIRRFSDTILLHLARTPHNYSSPPTITINPGGSSIQSIFIAQAGTNYTTAATIQITGGGGTGATAQLVFVQAMGTIISGVTITNAGYGYTSVPTVTIIPNGTGSGAVVGTVNFNPIASGANIQSILNGSVNSVTFIDDGSGYTDQPPLVEFSGGGGTGAAANTTLYTDNLDRKGPVTLRMNNLNGNS